MPGLSATNLDQLAECSSLAWLPSAVASAVFLVRKPSTLKGALQHRKPGYLHEISTQFPMSLLRATLPMNRSQVKYTGFLFIGFGDRKEPINSSASGKDLSLHEWPR